MGVSVRPPVAISTKSLVDKWIFRRRECYGQEANLGFRKKRQDTSEEVSSVGGEMRETDGKGKEVSLLKGLGQRSTMGF